MYMTAELAGLLGLDKVNAHLKFNKSHPGGLLVSILPTGIFCSYIKPISSLP